MVAMAVCIATFAGNLQQGKENGKIVMKTLPAGVSSFAKSPEFSEESIPKNLQKMHRTSARTWAKIVVLEGKLRYRILEPEVQDTELSPEESGIVEPEVAHEVKALGNVRFYVEFFR